jgi:hypothetical protein
MRKKAVAESQPAIIEEDVWETQTRLRIAPEGAREAAPTQFAWEGPPVDDAFDAGWGDPSD